MDRCPSFQARMLDRLYDLLEPAEAQALDAHLAGCADCRAAHGRAQKQRSLLAAAAKVKPARAMFRPPAEPAPPTVRIPRPQAAPGWIRWAVAAGILFAAAGASWLGEARSRPVDRMARAEERHHSATAQLARLDADYTARRNSADADLRKAQQEIQGLVAATAQQIATTQQEAQALQARHWQELNQLRQQAAGQALKLVLTGPPAVEPGAPNEYRVEVQDRANRPVAAHVSARVLDGAGRVVYEDPEVRDHRLSLPRDLPATPGSDLRLLLSARAPGGPKGRLEETVPLTGRLYLTHLATDKPMYQPGEVVHFRSLTLERFRLTPAREELRLIFTLTRPTGEKETVAEGAARLTDANGVPVLGPDGKPLRGVGAGEYTLPADAPGGEYTLAVREAQDRFPPQERKFLVNRYEKPQLDKELEFTKKTYGPGEPVTALCKAVRATGEPVAHRPVRAAVQIDGKTYDAAGREAAGATIAGTTDAKGAVNVRFTLPAQIDKGQASLSVTFDDGGNVETIVRAVPVVLKKLKVEFYPEGGDLVAGLPNRVYFQALTTLDKPAELKGRVVDDRGTVVAEVQTFNEPTEPGANQGTGAFTFTPQRGRTYELRIDSPGGIEGDHRLPTPVAEGVVLHVPEGVTGDREPIRVTLRATSDRSYLVGAYCRGRLMAHQTVQARRGEPVEVSLRPESGVGGVYRVTVFEQPEAANGAGPLTPRAERLVYRVPAERLKLSVQPDKKSYSPGEPVKLEMEARDEHGRPAPAVLLVAVVDQSVLKLADDKTFRAMPTHFLLTTEVRRPEELEYADFLLGDHPKAATALDLLLGTQGWRRFAEQDPTRFRKENGAEADRMLVRTGRLERTVDSDRQALVKAEQDFQAMLGPVQDRLARAQRTISAAQALQAAAFNPPAAGPRAAAGPADVAFDPTLAQLSARLRQAAAARAQLLHDPQEAAQRERLVEEAKAARAEYAAAAGQLDRLRDLGRRFRTVVLPLVALALAAAGAGSLAVGLLRRREAISLPSFGVAACSLLLLGLVGVFYLAFSPAGAPELARTLPPPEEQLAQGPRQENDQVGLLETNMQVRPQGAFPGVAPAVAGAPVDKAANAPAAELPMEKRDANVNREGKELQILAEEQGRYRLRAKVQGPGKGGGRANQKDAAQRQAQAKKEFEVAGGAIPKQAAALGVAPQLLMDRRRIAGRRLQKAFDDRDEMMGEEPMVPLVVREYAHVHTHGEVNVRQDFTETVYWQPALVLPDGKGEATFDLPDSVTSFQILAAGHALDGRLGSVTASLESRIPLAVQPKLPVEISSGDVLDLPVSVSNNTDSRRDVTLRGAATGLHLVDGKPFDQLSLDPQARSRRIYRFRPEAVQGEAKVSFEAATPGAPPDRLERTLSVVPDGFPVVGSKSDMLAKSARIDVDLPGAKDGRPGWIAGTLQCRVTAYPSALADLQKGLEGLLQEPSGCFEQTSTSNYPNLLVLDFLRQTDQAHPEVARRAQELLDRGYQKLLAFECLNQDKNRREGYEWFGGTAPAHEALTAYGLMQFRDMARVHDVDAAMIERTRTYLMSRKDGKGGFLRNPRALDTFGRAPEAVTNAYIVWALTESSPTDDVARELAALTEQARVSKDPYFLALVANSLLNREQTAVALEVLKKIAQAQKPEGYLEAAQTSITGSGGRDLQIETTALALLGWLKAGRLDLFGKNIQDGIRWISQQRGGQGAFGSTQSTILALKALIAYARASQKTAEAGDLVLYAGDREVARTHFEANAQDALVLDVPDAEKALKAGHNSVRVEITGKSAFPYTASWSYRVVQPPSAQDSPVRLHTHLDRAEADEGETVRLSVEVENHSGKGQGMAVAVVGLPAGLTVPEDLKDLKDLIRLPNDGSRPKISAFELRGRELVLYWRDLAPDAQGDRKIAVHLPLICRVPGEYRGPASRAYLYYNADHKHWVEPLRIAIRPH